MYLPPALRKALLFAWSKGTLPLRRGLLHRFSARGQAPLLVLFYHRVADRSDVPWTHTYAEFARQMRWLKRHCELVTLAEAQRRIASGENRRLAASVTFDDGYAENCDRAIPLLIEEQIPCTYFVSTWYVNQQQPFPHDLARGFRLPPNTPVQLRMMAEAGIEIGAHTRTHPNLGAIRDPDRIYDEVIGGRNDLEDMIGRPVRYFAFPYGLRQNMQPGIFALLAHHGFSGVCSAYGDYNFPGEDPFHIRRVHADSLLYLANWATLDPRKLRGRLPYEYDLPSIDAPRQEPVAV